jgi:hypothetical protein
VGAPPVDTVLGVRFGSQNRARLGNQSDTPGRWPRLRHNHSQNSRVRCVKTGPEQGSMSGRRDVHHIRYAFAVCMFGKALGKLTSRIIMFWSRCELTITLQIIQFETCSYTHSNNCCCMVSLSNNQINVPIMIKVP